jgi:hypothetical protein
MKKYKILLPFIPVIILMAIYFGALYVNSDAVKAESDSKKREIDSLKAEIFVKQLEVQRYEYILDQLDSNCKQVADSIMSNTE